MEKIGIVVDEVAELTREIIEKHQIVVVPIKLNWPELKKMPGENTFQKMRELEKRGIKSFGKTSQPSPRDFLDAFRKQLGISSPRAKLNAGIVPQQNEVSGAGFDKVLCITITSKLSGTYNSAIQARKFLKPEDQAKVFIIDSLNASSGQALVVIKAIDLIESGKGIKEILRELKEFIPRVHFFMMLEDPKWLEASGRISHFVANLMRSMAKAGIRPLLSLKKGVLVPAGIRTNAKDIPTALFRQFGKETKKSRKEGKRIRVVITHGDDLKGAQRLKKMIENKFKNTEVVFLNIINNVVGGPTGPDTLICGWCEF